MDLGLPNLGPADGVAWGSVARGSLARLLRWVSAVLARLATNVATPSAGHRRAEEPVVEFHLEAGAPEGALYVDGKLVGTLVGVQRL